DFDLRRFEAAAEKIAALPIFICDRTDLSSRDMVARMRRLQQRHGKLGAVLVDYVQIAHERGSHGMNRNTEIGFICSTLRGGAKELGVPVILLSQLGREDRTQPNRRPRLSDLRDSGNLEQAADVVIFIFRDEA